CGVLCPGPNFDPHPAPSLSTSEPSVDLEPQRAANGSRCAIADGRPLATDPGLLDLEPSRSPSRRRPLCKWKVDGAIQVPSASDGAIVSRSREAPRIVNPAACVDGLPSGLMCGQRRAAEAKRAEALQLEEFAQEGRGCIRDAADLVGSLTVKFE